MNIAKIKSIVLIKVNSGQTAVLRMKAVMRRTAVHTAIAPNSWATTTAAAMIRWLTDAASVTAAAERVGGLLTICQIQLGNKLSNQLKVIVCSFKIVFFSIHCNPSPACRRTTHPRKRSECTVTLIG